MYRRCNFASFMSLTVIGTLAVDCSILDPRHDLSLYGTGMVTLLPKYVWCNS